jgi:hypothetical protein
METLKYSIALMAALIVMSAIPVTALAAVADSPDKLPDNATIEKLELVPVGISYLDSLIATASGLNDYQCYCEMAVLKNNQWKSYGGANLFFKQREKIRAEIVSSDYRNGSVVVKQSDGRIRGKGGGALKMIKMTMQPDSRQIRLPTGFSLAQSDFASLFDTVKHQLSGRVEATSSAAITLPAFDEPVKVLIVRSKDEGLLHAIYLNPKTKIPIAWNTYVNGQPHAVVFFDKLDVNKGLSEDLFRL